MHITPELVEQLLSEDESVSLDFKAACYPFGNADADAKSELLKDLLAFANSFRRSDAFILIGVRDVKGTRGDVIGITPDIDDAALQQFANSKTNAPLDFSLKYLQIEGKTVGIIHIPIQRRPFYLKRAYGKLKAHAVYIRHGSSTAIASLEEIAAMGSSPPAKNLQPALEIFFADPKRRKRLPPLQRIQTTIVAAPKASEIPAFHTKVGSSFFPTVPIRDNGNYYREFFRFYCASKAMKPFYLGLHNAGNASAREIRVEIRSHNDRGDIFILNRHDFPEKPKATYDPFVLPSVQNFTFVGQDSFAVKEIGAEYLVEAEIDIIRPKDYYWIESPMYIGRVESGDVRLSVKIFSGDSREPVEQKLDVLVEVDRDHLSVEDLLILARDGLGRFEER